MNHYFSNLPSRILPSMSVCFVKGGEGDGERDGCREGGREGRRISP